VVEDSESGATRALSAFNKLATVDRVPVVVGFVLSDEVLAVAPAANQQQVVLLSTAAGSDEIKQAGDFVFRNRESASLQAQAIATAVHQMGFNQIAILHSQSANGVSYRDTFRKAAEALNITVSPIIAYNEGKDDYRAEIEHLRRTAPRAVYLAGLDQELGLILRQSGEVRFSPQFFASPGAISPKLLELAGPEAEGLVSASAAFDPQSSDPRIRSFITRYSNRYGDAPDFIAANSYDAVRLLANFFKDGVTTGVDIKARLYTTRNYAGIGGRTTFDRDGEVSKPIMLVRADHGVFRNVSAHADSAPRP
jgi:branched-chain amino acid transport system substrate-binding protein